MAPSRSEQLRKTTKTEALAVITSAPAGPMKIKRLAVVEPDQIARRAYELFEARGGEHGRDLEDWLQAEQELYASQVAAARNSQAQRGVTPDAVP
jgi:hypothetical protein